MSNFLNKIPVSPITSFGNDSVPNGATFGTNFSILQTGGYMEVYSLSGLTYTIPPATNGIIEFSGNSIPIQFTKGSGSVFSPDVLTLNSDNISSGRRKLGMLVYVYETNKIYQFRIDNYNTLWNNATGATGPGGPTVVISDYGTTVKNNSSEGIAFISAWTSSTISGIGGYNDTNASWRVLQTGSSGGGTFTGGTVSGATIFTNGLTANTISATTYQNLPATPFLPLSGGTVSGATRFTSGLTANTISATTISATNYIGLPSDIYVTSGDIDHDANLINLYRNADTTVQITNLVTVIDKSRFDIMNTLIPSNSLVKGVTYKVVNCDSSLYDNRNGDTFTTVYLNAIENNVLSDTGIGVFYTPKYINDNGWEIWSPLSILQVRNIIGEFQPDESITSNNGATGIIFGDITSELFYIVGGDWTNAKEITGDVYGATAKISSLTIKQYNYGDVVFWGGTAWFVTDTFSSVAAVAVDIFNLDTTTYPIIQMLPLNNEQYYNISYDEVKYDIVNDRITYRKDKNNNIVSTTKVNIDYWVSIGKYNPIKVFKWGHDLTVATEKGIGNQKIVNSYNENINFRGTSQYNIEMDTLSYQTNIYGEGNDTNQFNIYLSNSYQNNIKIVNTAYQKNVRLENQSYQTNLNILSGSTQERVNFENQSYQSGVTITTTSNQKDIVFENKASQYNVKFTGSSYQERVKFYNFGFDRLFASVNEVDKIYTNTLVTDNSAPQVIGIKNNELVEVDVNSLGGTSPITVVNGDSLFSTGLSNTGVDSSGVTDSIFFGVFAGGDSNASGSTFIGRKAGYNAIDASYSNFIGYEVGMDANNAKWSNFIGNQAGVGAYGSDSSNFLGYYAGQGAFGASSSNFLGPNAGQGAYNANNSNFFGPGAGVSAGVASYSNFFGYSVGRSFGSNYVGSNNIIIGTNISLPNGVANSINLGGVLFGTGTYSTTTGNPSITGQTNGRIGINVVTPLQALHVSGGTLINGGLTATTISATTYLNLPSSTFTGGTVSGATSFTGGLTATTISATTYQNLPTDIRVTGGTYSNGTAIFTNNTGGTFNVTGLTTPFTGGTVSGATSFTNGLTANTISATTYQNLPSSTFTGGTVSGATIFTNGLTATTISATTYQNLPVSGVTGGTGISATTSNGLVTIVNTSPNQIVTLSGGTGISTGGTYPNFVLTNTSPDQTVTISGGTNISVNGTYPNFGINFTGSTGASGDFLPLSGGTVTGATIFTSGLTANTISATTYQNLPTDIRVTGGTYSNGTAIFTNNTGGTFNVSGFAVGGGGGQIFYLNLSQSQGSNRLLSTTGSTASEQSTGVTINNGVTGTIASFQSQPLNTTLLPGGIWSFYLHSYKQNSNASFNIFVELYKRTSGGTQTLLFTTDPTPVTTNSPNPSMQLSDGYFSGTSLSVSDGVVVVVRATNTGNQSHSITLVTEGSTHYSYVVSTIPTQQGLTCDTLSGCSIIQTIQTDVSNKLDKSGGTITGNLIINSGLTATTISATTYQNLPSTPFLPLSGGTVTGNTIFTSGLSANTISATTYNGYEPADMRTDLTNRRLGYTVSTDFLSPVSALLSPFAFNASAGGTFVIVTNQVDNQHPGVQQLQSATGATNTGGYITTHIATNALSFVFMDGLQTDLIFKLPPTTTNNYIRIGFYTGSLVVTPPITGNYFEISGTTLVGITRASSVQSATSSFTLTANTWYHTRLKESIVGGSDTVTFSVYDMNGNVLYNQSSITNISTVTTRALTVFGVNTVSNAALTPIIYLDYLGLTFPPMIRGALN